MTAENGVPTDNARDLVDDLQAHLEYCQRAIESTLRYPGIREYLGLHVYMQLQDCLQPPVVRMQIKEFIDRLERMNKIVAEQQLFIKQQYQVIEELIATQFEDIPSKE